MPILCFALQNKTLYNEEVQSINLSYVEFANKQQILNVKNLSVYNTV